jgi:alkanesulfonate monooxygenase SsuD/methylene tetrahydromethanopterin reductase-like flavin-dependent oxidoreductase (luciferase family)
VIAEDEAVALDTARRAYRKWYANFMSLWWRHGRAPVLVDYPPEFDGQQRDGRGVAGSPKTVLETLRSQVAEAGANYFVCRFAFGDLSLEESLRSLELFVHYVMPALTPPDTGPDLPARP